MTRRDVGAGHPPFPPPFPHVPIPMELLSDPAVDEASIILWAWLYQFAVDHHSTVFEMTIDQMVELTKASKPSVLKRRDKLIEAGWLKVTVLPGLARPQQVTVRVPGAGVIAAADSPADV